MGINKTPFGKTPDGSEIDLYTMANHAGMQVKVLNYGGVISQLWVPDRHGKFQDIILGYDNPRQILADSFYLGAVIGRYANRIAGGKFTLDGKTYQLAQNSNGQHLHGGVKGFDKVVYQAETSTTNHIPVLKLRYLSRDGEEGYPGNLDFCVEYTLAETNELTLDYTAVSDKRTVVNFTNHMYFNLTGDAENDILQHELMINAAEFTPVNPDLIPTGKLTSLQGTPLDFQQPTMIGVRIESDVEQLHLARGYDHNYVLRGDISILKPAARVFEPVSGRILEILTTEPGIQFYSGNFLGGAVAGKGGKLIKHRCGLCLEPQHFPDSPNQPGFPSTVLDPGQTYHSQTVYRFSTAAPRSPGDY
jgi:aldose 1-epimerase